MQDAMQQVGLDEQRRGGLLAQKQGFAQAQAPDVVLREDRLAEGLAWLCDEVGATSAPLPSVQEPAPVPLAAIWDEELEVACRDAYGRDYIAFGYGDYAA